MPVVRAAVAAVAVAVAVAELVAEAEVVVVREHLQEAQVEAKGGTVAPVGPAVRAASVGKVVMEAAAVVHWK